MTEAARFYGKYRGTVLNNVDPQQQGRLLVSVPDVLGVLPSTWAMPCVPFTGRQSGLWVLPVVGSGVWVEFEQGDPGKPVWVGGWWALGEAPALALAATPVAPNIVLQTQGQTSLVLADATGILLKTPTGAAILINEAGITLSNGKGATIVMAGPAVTINAGALVVN